MNISDAQLDALASHGQRLVHGTSGHLRSRIERQGLLEPFAGRGVSLALQQDVHVARQAAAGAALQHRHDEGGTETTGAGLLVWTVATKDLPGEVVIDLYGRADRTSTRFAVHVPSKLIRLERIEVVLPEVGSPPRAPGAEGRRLCQLQARLESPADDGHRSGW